MAVSRRNQKMLALAIVLIALVAVFVVLRENKGQESVAEVRGRKLTETDLADHDRIYNAVRRYQQRQDQSVSLALKDEVLQDLIEVTLIELEVEKRGIKVSQNEIDERKISDAEGLLREYGWSEADYEKKIRNDLFREKLEDELISWREAEFVALRIDVQPEEDQNAPAEEFIATLKAKAKEVFELVRDDFAAGIPAADIAASLESNRNVIGVFPPNTIQYKHLGGDALVGRLQRVTNANAISPVDKYILGLSVPTKAEVWCADDACYLIRVMRGKEGEFETFAQWLSQQKI